MGNMSRTPPPRTATGKVSFEPDMTKIELKAVKDDILIVKRDLDRMAVESRTSLAKISHIEDLLRQSLVVVCDDVVHYQDV